MFLSTLISTHADGCSSATREVLENAPNSLNMTNQTKFHKTAEIYKIVPKVINLKQQ